MTISESAMAQELLESARENLEAAIVLLKSIGHDDTVGWLELALDEMTAEITTLDESSPAGGR